MRCLALLLLLAASGASAQTDPRLYGAWSAQVDDLKSLGVPGYTQGAMSMWIEFDAQGRVFMFGQAEMAEPGEMDRSSDHGEYTMEDGKIVWEGSADVQIRDHETMILTSGGLALEYVKTDAGILGLDVLGLWEVIGGSAYVVSFTTDETGLPSVTFHLSSAERDAPGYNPADAGTWTVSASGLTLETTSLGTVTYTALLRDGEQITLTTASGETLTLQPLAE